ncbi:hypothetical protein ACFXPI_35670 [Streptomyces sp. NPDC059104]|uniref:hypothetical protein n=1 Tax=Streptomyces sp. NPDC059104 TaxID=3346729 RepID=UPI00368C4BCE
MAALTRERLLRGWEEGLGQGRVARAVALAAAAGGHSFEEACDLPLGARDALLVALRGACFRGDVQALADCPACGEELEVAVPLSDLRPRGEAVRGEVTVLGHRVRFRALTSRDVLAVEAAGPACPGARRDLVTRCVLAVDGEAVDGEAVGEGAGGDGAVGDGAVGDGAVGDGAVGDGAVGDGAVGDGAVGVLGDEVLDAVAAALPSVDPGADIRLDLTCALCGHGWAAPFDVAAHLWADVDACARGLLADVHTLARAYGWREEEVLALSAARRRFYLEAVGA